MDEQQIENVWRQFCLPVYNKNSRHRLYAITPESKRQLVALYRACGDASDTTEAAQATFGWAIEQFTDCGVNAAKAEIEAAQKNLESLEAAATILRDEIPFRYTLCRPHGLRDDSDYRPYRNQDRPIGRLEPT